MEINPRLQKLVHSFAILTDEDWQLIRENAEEVNLAKGTYWIREGQICQQIGFVVQGVLRVFSTVGEKELIAHFCFERRNPIVSAYTSFINQTPSVEAIQALEDTTLLVLNRNALNDLYERKAIFQKLGRLLTEQMYVMAKMRIYDLQHKTALERYQELLDKYPNIINRIAHRHIAAYLGIAPESLSRLRRQLMA